MALPVCLPMVAGASIAFPHISRGNSISLFPPRLETKYGHVTKHAAISYPLRIVRMSRSEPEPGVMQALIMVVIYDTSKEPNPTDFRMLLKINRCLLTKSLYIFRVRARKNHFSQMLNGESDWTQHSGLIWSSNCICWWRNVGHHHPIDIKCRRCTKIPHRNYYFQGEIYTIRRTSKCRWRQNRWWDSARWYRSKHELEGRLAGQLNLTTETCPGPLTSLHHLKLTLGGFSRAAHFRGLLSDLIQSEVGEDSKRKCYRNAEYLKAGLNSPGPEGSALALLGFVIFAYSYWQGKVGTKLNWLRSYGVLFLIIAGLLTYGYGLVLSLNGGQDLNK